MLSGAGELSGVTIAFENAAATSIKATWGPYFVIKTAEEIGYILK